MILQSIVVNEQSMPISCVYVILFGNLSCYQVLLTHWGRVAHICLSERTIIGSDNGLSPDRHQAIIWTSAGILLIGPWGTNFIEILIGIHTFSFKKIHLKMSSGKWRPFCLGLNVLRIINSLRSYKGIMSNFVVSTACWWCKDVRFLGHFSQTWFNFNPNMNK